jgi:hypothetical protein
MTDIDPIRRRHNDFVSSHPCSTDTCDTRVVLEALDETMADRDERASRHVDSEYDLITRLVTAHADADRLAEALRQLLDALDPDTPCRTFRVDLAREALRESER